MMYSSSACPSQNMTLAPIGSSMLMILVRTYLDKPSFTNLESVHSYMRLMLDARPTQATARRVLKVRLVLFRHACNESSKIKFKVFTSREFLIRFIRSSAPTEELDSLHRCTGFPNRVAASSTQLN